MGITGNMAGWSILTGTDVTDIDFSESTVYIGATSVDFKATAVATAIRGDVIEIPLGAVMELCIVLRRTAGSSDFAVGIEVFDAALNSIGSSTFVFNPPTNGVWSASRAVISGIATHDNRIKFIRATLAKATATADQFFVGSYNLQVHRRAFHAVKNSNQVITAAGGVQIVTFALEDFDYGVFQSNAWDPPADNTGAAHARKHSADYRSIWQFNANILYTGMADGETAWVALYKNAGSMSVGNVAQAAASAQLRLHVSDTVLIRESDTVDVRTDHSSASDRTLASTFVASGDANYFSGFELTP